MSSASAEQLDALAHAEQPDAAQRIGVGRRTAAARTRSRRPRSRSRAARPDRPGARADATLDQDGGGRCVPDDVGDRFLDDAEERDLDGASARQSCSSASSQRVANAGPAELMLGQPFDRSGQAEIVEDGRPQVGDDAGARRRACDRRASQVAARSSRRHVPGRRAAPSPCAATSWLVSSCSSRATRRRSSSCAEMTRRSTRDSCAVRSSHASLEHGVGAFHGGNRIAQLARACVRARRRAGRSRRCPPAMGCERSPAAIRSAASVSAPSRPLHAVHDAPRQQQRHRRQAPAPATATATGTRAVSVATVPASDCETPRDRSASSLRDAAGTERRGPRLLVRSAAASIVSRLSAAEQRQRRAGGEHADPCQRQHARLQGSGHRLIRGASPRRTPLHALSLAASPARSDRVARSR